MNNKTKAWIHNEVKAWSIVLKFFLILLMLCIILTIPFLLFEWCKYCGFNFPDISQEQVFECNPRISNVYATRIIVEGEVADSIQLLIYKHTDLKHTGIAGTSFVESHKISGTLDTTITLGWHSGIKLFGVIQPLSNAKGHLKVGCYFKTEFM